MEKEEMSPGLDERVASLERAARLIAIGTYAVTGAFLYLLFGRKKEIED